jgi:hypothetical protein
MKRKIWTKKDTKNTDDYNSNSHVFITRRIIKRKKKEKRGGVRENAFRAKEEAEAEDKKQHR